MQKTQGAKERWKQRSAEESHWALAGNRSCRISLGGSNKGRATPYCSQLPGAVRLHAREKINAKTAALPRAPTLVACTGRCSPASR
eukprot:1901196-Pleurochrysis_carterae.AAC.1